MSFSEKDFSVCGAKLTGTGKAWLLMSESKVCVFSDKIKDMLGAVECVSFSGRIESIMALFDVLQVRSRDCVFVSAFVSRDILKLITMCGVLPVFCDVLPDSLTIDPRQLESKIRVTVDEGIYYPRAVIADNFCGMPFASRAVRTICNQFGLILVEDCGKDFGGRSGGAFCGSVGDYSLISLGASSAFGTGGVGALLVSNCQDTMKDGVKDTECGRIYHAADEIYGDSLCESVEKIPELLEKSAEFAANVREILSEKGCWLQYEKSRQKSSYGSITVISSEKENSDKLVEALADSGFSHHIRRLHLHKRQCMDGVSTGISDMDNAGQIEPRAFTVDVFGLLHSGKEADFIEKMQEAAALIN